MCGLCAYTLHLILSGDCGGTITLNSSSYIHLTTPGYPDSFSDGLHCYWLIQVKAVIHVINKY